MTDIDDLKLCIREAEISIAECDAEIEALKERKAKAKRTRKYYERKLSDALQRDITEGNYATGTFGIE